jgi:Chaperone of endosialidase
LRAFIYHFGRCHRLKPVSFRYKAEIDRSRLPRFGLIAEEVENVQSDLVLRDKEGTPYSVRYDQVNAMLLNEFLKEHRKVQEREAMIARLKSTDAKQEAIIAKQQKQIEPLTAGLQKVSARLELNKPAPQMVKNND